MYHLLHDRVEHNPVEGEENFAISPNDCDYGIYSNIFSFGAFVSCTSSTVIGICVIEA